MVEFQLLDDVVEDSINFFWLRSVKLEFEKLKEKKKTEFLV